MRLSNRAARTPTHRRWRTFAFAFLVTLAPMLAWTLATPLSASPDEPAHAIRAAAVVRGNFVGEQPGQTWSMTASVPRWVAHSVELPCMAFHAEISAACQPALRGDPNETVTTSTTAGVNNPTYYLVTGLPSLVMSGNAGLYAMRGVNAVLTAGLLAFAFMALRQLARNRWATLALSVSVTPMVLFLGGVLNPNGVEFAAGASLLATLIVVFSQPSPRILLWERGAIIFLSTCFLTSTRNISLLWLVLALILALLFSRRAIVRQLVSRTATWVTLGLSLTASGLALAWFSRSFGSTVGPPAQPGASALKTIQDMVLFTLDYNQAWVGLFGWMDRFVPLVSLAIWTTVIVAITIAATLFARQRARIAIVIVLLTIVLLPALSQAAVISTLGLVWQGRYTLALFFFLMIACGIALDASRVGSPRPALAKEWNRVIAAIVFLVGFGHVAAFVWVLARYVVGSNDVWLMVVHPLWQPPLSWEGLTLIFTGFIAIGLWFVWRATRVPSGDTPEISTLTRRHVSHYQE